MEDAPCKSTIDPSDRVDEKLQDLVPADPNKPYDMHEIIQSVIDNKHFLEVQPRYAQNIICGFARFAGQPVGIVANQPAHLAGVLDINSSTKAARFVRFCDAFNLPLITFVDVPGFPSRNGTGIRRNYKTRGKTALCLLGSNCPKITLITRKAYGGAYDVMSSKHIGGDVNFAYPTAEIAVMGPEGAINILYRNKYSEEERVKAVNDYREKFANPYKAASLGYIDEIIHPRDTRKKIIGALEMTRNKRKSNPPKKHGNIPLNSMRAEGPA
jgi:propionyl-CoA carboxylase beta chain